MDTEFLEGLQKKQPDYKAIFKKLHTGVINTNALIGQVIHTVDEDTYKGLITSYEKLLVEELGEVKEAVENKDRENLVGEIVDVLVVGGFLYYLNTKEVYSCRHSYEGLVEPYNLLQTSSCVESILHMAQAMLQQMDCNVELAVDEILRANNSKFATLEQLQEAFPLSEDFVQTQIQMIEEGGRYSEVICKEVIDNVGNTRYCFYSGLEYGKPKVKYLKAASFKVSDLSKVWEN